MERQLYRNIADQAREVGCTLLALGGIEDHVHLVVSLPATVTVAQLAKQVKGASSHFAGDVLSMGTGNKWQGFYGAFTVSRWDLDRVIGYVRRQKEHHGAQEGLVTEWEETAEEVDVG
ncbi:MAG: IS200/IS605 family transposase [Anaerolineae bacterium]